MNQPPRETNESILQKFTDQLAQITSQLYEQIQICRDLEQAFARQMEQNIAIIEVQSEPVQFNSQFQETNKHLQQILESINGLVTDLTEYQQAEEKRHAREWLYRAIAQNFPDGAVAIFDQHLRYILAEGSDLTALGFSGKNLEGRTIWETWPQEISNALEPMFRATLLGEENSAELIYKNRSYVLQFIPFKKETEEIVGGIVIAQLKNTDQDLEAELQASQLKYKTIFDICPIGISITDSQGNIIEVNPASERILGIAATEHITLTYDDDKWRIIRADGTPMPKHEFASVRALAENQWVENIEMGIIKATNEITWMSVTAAPIPLPNYGVAIAYIDITEHKQAQRQIQQTHDFLQTLVDQLPLAVFVKDLNPEDFGIFRLWNKTCERMFGISAEEAIGKTVHDFFPKEQADFFAQKDREVALRCEPEDIAEEPIDSYSLGRRLLHTVKIPMLNNLSQPQYLLCISEDITERKLAEAKVREQNEILQTIFDQIPILICFYNADGEIRLLNRAVETSLGWSLADLEQYDLLAECYPDPEYCASVVEFMQVANGEWRDLQTRTRDGRILETAWTNICLSNGTRLGIGQDITKRKQAEIALRQREELYRTLTNHAPVGIFQANIAGQLTFVNQRWCEIVGLTSSEALGMGWVQAVHPDDQALIVEQWQNVAPHQPTHHEFRFVHADGTVVWVISNSAPLGDEQANFQGIVGTILDISNLKHAQKEQAKFATILESSRDYVSIADADGYLIYLNQAGRQMLKIPPEETLSGIHFLETIPPRLMEKIFNQEMAKLMEQGFWIGESALESRDGQEIPVSQMILVHRDETNAVEFFSSVARDIRDLKQAEQTLRRQAERERLLMSITQRIRQSLDLEQILAVAVAEVRETLQCDRVLIFRLNADRSGVVVKQAVVPEYPIPEEMFCYAECFPQVCHEYYLQGQPRMIVDVTQELGAQCLKTFMAEMGVKSKIVAPITQHTDEGCCRLWGLLVVHSCQNVRQWQASEADLLQQISNQLAIAIQQSQLYQQLQEANQDLQQLATVDKLTQVSNRRRFDEYLLQEWERMTREKEPLSLILCDIDFFKRYNDTYGHLAGDHCLKQVAATISRVVKRPADLVCRYGGEEFAIILPNTNLRGAVKVAELIRRTLKELMLPHSASLHGCVTLSLGVASCIPTAQKLPEMLIAGADHALYQSKEQGRDRLTVFKMKVSRK